MPGWDELLEPLAGAPRDNGTAALHATAAWLVETLERAGLEAEMLRFTAHPYALRLAGVIALVGALGYARLVFASRWKAALAVAVLIPSALLAELELGRPVFGWIGAQEQHHVRTVIGPDEPAQRLLLTAHYDTKTDLLDHVERAPVDWLGPPVALALLVGAVLGWRGFVRTARAVAVVGVLYGVAAFAALSAGAFAPSRSPGALDDGASCAVLLRLAGELAERSPERTAVEILWLSAEEVGVQGSRAYADARFREPPRVPTWVVNLEGLGASPRHELLRRERFAFRFYAPDPRLAERLDAVHRAALGAPLGRTFYVGATDARSFLARGVPAATLVTHPPGQRVPRGLHTPADSLARVDRGALDASFRLLAAFVQSVDSEPLR